MGDFDRNNNDGKPNETKKMVIVLVLGVVLIGLVATQLMKGGGPQAVAGAPVTNDVALPPPVVSEEISPAALTQMIAKLEEDPTKPLLREVSAGDAGLNNAPRNPFRMSAGWVGYLSKPVPQVQPQIQPTPQITTFAPPTTQTGPQPVAPRAEDYKLNSVINGTMAIINGKIVQAGDLVGKARVVEVSDNTVTLRLAEFPNGPTTTIQMRPRLNLE